MTYIYNAWYPAGWVHELEKGPIARKFLDIPVMIYRLSTGVLAALHDRCPHRFAPFSYGTIVEDKVRCIYHGLEFDSAGRCVGNALCFAAPKVAKVRSFPVFEQDNVVWIWMGEEEPADTSTIPRYAYHNDPKYRCVYGNNYTKADYRLLCDNLMDLTHIVLLHPVFDALHRKQSFKSWEEGDDVLASYSAVEPHEEYHTINTIRWAAPGNHDLEMHIIPDFGKGPVIQEWSANLLTPETKYTSHYLWSVAVSVDSPETDEQIYDRMIQVVDREDSWMIEGVQDRMGEADLFDLDPVLIATDAAGVRMRRKLAAMVEKDAARRAARAASREAAPVSA
ncbi:ring-hydroxylating dioxygenase, large terminal subunit [Caulobacter sp. AP07]|uniref:aromatic ring-hydroxylating dioxygenase subunit alpha n=1 Tax=Caulobacter sp. AP07 TaxID=1144304 RepID=UPI0002720C5D|nr:aromatic ring-hydroxylating dioxygenase subunit alpha [Caulobacter sp. AP07]EJL27338.1 ring-hydroxylating dioxygenase, large terminal subunit [Caulobacter sp. AP07]